jgi:PAS domain S-box-containing protein
MSPETKINILLVDDHPENLLALEGILESLGQNLVRATSGSKALKCLLDQDFAVILLDVQMPDMDGFETATLIRQRERSRYTPIIFLTAFSSSDEMVTKGYSLGAVDYLFKPINADILKSKVTAFVELFQKTAKIERQSAELAAMNAELKKSEERFRGLSASSPLGIFLTDINGICTYANPRYQAIFGVTEAEILGEGWAQIIHPDDLEQVSNEWYNAARAGNEYRGEFRIIRPDRVERWIYACSSPMYCSLGELIGHVGSIEDVSERKIVEAQKIELIREQAARHEAEAANRLKDEFLATLSHELRTPLNSMLGWAKLLRKQKYDEKSVVRGLEIIERNALLQTQLINDILDVSRIMRGQLRLNLCPVNLESLISQSVNAVRVEAEAKKLQIDYIVKPNLSGQIPSFTVRGDSNRLQQVIGNLLSNAIKFTPASGRIEVRLSIINKAGSIDYSTSTTCPTPLIQVEVSDTGIGISHDFLPHVFDRFRQEDGSTTKSHNGLGLGLAIVRHLVEMHGGSVSVTSPGAGAGATFTVQLPLFETSKELKVDKQISPNSLSNQSLKAEGTTTKVTDIQQDVDKHQQENVSNFSTPQSEEIGLTEIEDNKSINMYLSKPVEPTKLITTLSKLASET